MNKKITNELKNIILITIGSALLALGISAFLLPAQIVTGGTPGLSIVIYYLANIPVPLAMILVNITLIIAGIRFIDSTFAIRTVYSVSMTSLFISLYPYLFNFPKISEIILSSLYGGGCIGIGIGLILKGQASAGGTTIIAKIVSNYSALRPAQAMLILDIIIISSIAIINKNMELALWSLLSIYITAKTIDKILSGSVSEKVVNIVSDHCQSIGISISQELSRKGTILTGQDLNLGNSKQVLFVVVGSREIEQLKKIINQLDEQALVIVMEASEMMGPHSITK